MPCHDFNAVDSLTGESPHSCAQFNPGGYETVIFLQHIYGDTLLSGRPRYTSLNSWEIMLHLLLSPNPCYCPLPQEMELDFCTVLPLCSLTSQAELMLSLFLFCAVREAGLQLCRLRARLSGDLANSHCSGDTLVLQGCLCQSSRKVQESQREELGLMLFELHHGLLSGNPFCSLR